MNVAREGFLSAIFLEPSNPNFENSDMYRLRYQLRENGSIRITSAGGDTAEYPTIKEFRRYWDMDAVDERYRKNNPTF